MARKPGKYEAVLANRKDIPTLPGVEPERRAIVEATIDSILALPKDDDPPPPTVNEIERLLAEGLDRVKEIIERMRRGCKPNAAGFSRRYAELRDIRARVDNWGSNVGLLGDAYESLMIEQLKVEGLKSIQLEGGRGVSTHDEPVAQVDDAGKFRAHILGDVTVLRGEAPEPDPLGLEPTKPAPVEFIVLKAPNPVLFDLLTVNYQTMNSHVKELLLAGLNEPPGIGVKKRTAVRLGAKA